MTLFQKIRTSFTTQLTLLVVGFVTVLSAVVIILLGLFSQEIIHEETVEMTLQALENTAVRIDNTLRQTEMRSNLDKQTRTIDRESIAQLIDKNGIQTKLRQTLPNATLHVEEMKSLNKQLSFITPGESGYHETEYEGEKCYIFYHPLHDGDYCLIAVSPASDIYGRYKRMQWLLLVSGVAGVLFLLFVLYIVTGRHLRPLHRLADAAQSIAQGDLDSPIPDTRHQDETGRLQNSLSKMQHSLKAYFDEMRQKQAMLSRQNTALNAAYAEVRDYEAMKTSFLRDMTERMAAPVDSLCQLTDRICDDYATMTKAEIARLQLDIMQNSEVITSLLDQLMKETVVSTSRPSPAVSSETLISNTAAL
jgi:HAMP domain-containing protein